MFEKIVTNALMSPELVGDLRLYSRKLKARCRQYKWATILALLFIILQYIGLAYSSSTPAASPSDALYGGISGKQSLLAAFDSESSFSSLARSLNISRDTIANATVNDSEMQLNGSYVIWSPIPTYQTSLSLSPPPHPTFALHAQDDTYYGYPLGAKTHPITSQASLLLQSPGHTWIVLKQTGNIITDWETAQKASFCYKNPESIEESYTHCPYGQKVKTGIEIQNLSNKTSALFMKPQPNEKLEYSLIATNTNNTPIIVTPQINISDLLEYTHLDSYSTATLSSNGQALVWPKVAVPPHTTVSHNFTVKVKSSLPLTARGSDNINSYDCQLSSFYGGTSQTVSLRCPPAKTIERLLHFPQSTSLFVCYWIFFVISLLLYLRHRTLYKESKIILHILRRRP